MKKSLIITLLGTFLLGGYFGCGKQQPLPPPQATPTPQPVIQPTPTPRPTGKMVLPTDVLNSQDAMTASDVNLLCRSGLTENQVIEDIKRRGLVDVISGDAARSFAEKGVSQQFLQVIANYDYVLTNSERQRYLQRQQTRNAQRENAYRESELAHKNVENENMQQGGNATYDNPGLSGGSNLPQNSNGSTRYFSHYNTMINTTQSTTAPRQSR